MGIPETCISRRTLLVFLVLLLPLVLLKGIYRPHHSDDAWTVSWAYQAIEKGSAVDQTFDPDSWGTKIFSRTYTFLYGTVLSAAGWTRSAAHTITLVLALASLFLWYQIFLRLFPRGEQALLAVFILGISEAFLSTAHIARVDMLTFFLTALGILLFLRKRWFWAILVLTAGVENHPLGLTGFFLILPGTARLAGRERNLKALGWMAAGGVVGIAYYAALHYPYLGDFPALIAKGTGAGRFNNYLAAHFFQFLKDPGNKLYYRSFPFLVFLILALLVLAARRRRLAFPGAARQILFLLAAGLGSTLVLSRGNGEYAVFLYPVFSAVIVLGLEELAAVRQDGLTPGWCAAVPWIPLFLAGCLLLYGGMYSYLAVEHAPARRFPEYRESLQALSLDPEIPVYGGFNDWFAFHDRDYRRNRLLSRKVPEERPAVFYWMEAENTLFHGRLDRASLPEGVTKTLLHSVQPPGGGTVRIYVCRSSQ